MEGQTARILAVLFAFLVSAFPALGGSAVDTATATCKDYENGRRLEPPRLSADC
jgi:hypothetical protein